MVFTNNVYHHRENFGNKTFFFLFSVGALGMILGNRFAVKKLCRKNPDMVCSSMWNAWPEF